MFTKNISTLDRNIRVAIGLALDMWFFSGLVEGPQVWAIGMVCVYLLATASARYCLFYALLGLPNKGVPTKAHHGW
jgi:hypothetical protein